jgi:tetratricopeptide (TPR) repeat protein
MDFWAESRTKLVHPIVAFAFVALVTVVINVAGYAQQPRSNSTPPQVSNGVSQLLQRGQVAQEQGRYDEALSIYFRVLVLSSRDTRTAAIANVRIGSVYLQERKLDAALASFQHSVSLNPDSAEAQNYLGETLGEMKQYRRAIECFNRAIALDATLLRARYNMGVTYARMGNTKYSEFVFRSLIKNSPNYSLGYDGLAVTLSRSGRAKEAIAFHEKAITLLPEEPSYYYNLGLSYLILGDTAKALEQQQKLREIDPLIADQLASVIVKKRM